MAEDCAGRRGYDPDGETTWIAPYRASGICPRYQNGSSGPFLWDIDATLTLDVDEIAGMIFITNKSYERAVVHELGQAHHAATNTVEHLAQRDMINDKKGEPIAHDDRPVEGPSETVPGGLHQEWGEAMKRVIAIVALVTATAAWRQGTCTASSVAPTQLSGLVGASILVWVSDRVPEASAVRERLLANARERLIVQARLREDNPDHVFIVLKVTAFPARLCQPGGLVVTTRLVVKERATLVRDPKIIIPTGYLPTWSEEITVLVSREESQEMVRNSADTLLELLAEGIERYRDR